MQANVLNRSNTSPRFPTDIENTIHELEIRIKQIVVELVRIISDTKAQQKSLLNVFQMRNELKDRAKIIKDKCRTHKNSKDEYLKVRKLYKETINVNYKLGSENVIKAWGDQKLDQNLFAEIAITLQIIHDLG